MISLLFVFFIKVAFAGDIIRKGSPDCQCIALTFDLCPVKEGSGYRPEIIAFLKKQKLAATFFISGRWMETHPKETKELLKNPLFEIGVHGHYHSHLPEKTEDRQLNEIQRPLMILKNKYKYTTSLFRPAFGEYNETTLKLTNALGLKFIMWSQESGDPDPNLSAERILQGLKSQTKAGNIVIFHANGNGLHTPEVIPKYFNEVIKPQKLKTVKISELIKNELP